MDRESGTMRKSRNSIFLGCLLSGACLAPLAAQAGPITNPVVSLELTGVAGPSLNGIYTDPYYGNVGPAGLTQDSQFTPQNSTSIAIYCDDFYDNVSTGQVWQATVTNLGQLSMTSPDTTLMFDTDSATQASDYMAAAWLVEQIAGGKLTTAQTELDSYAIWSIFDPNALQGLSVADSNAASEEYQDAFAAVEYDTPSQFSNVNIYTPLDSTPGSASSQEYLTVGAPEPSTLALALLGLGAIAFAVRRRRST
jgi:PEP-CTERM motif